jgi:hypothetical protein
LIVLGFGAVITIAGLLLQTIYRTDTGQSRVKVFGQEVEIPTPALVVFLAGCGIFALPFFFPYEPGVSRAVVDATLAAGTTSSPTGVSRDSSSPSGSTNPAVVGSTTARPPRDADPGTARGGSAPATASTREIEPNDDILHPNLLAIGSTINASIRPIVDKDFYRVASGRNVPTSLRIVIQNRSQRLQPSVTVWNQKFESVASNYSVGGDLYLSFTADPGTAYYVECHFISINISSTSGYSDDTGEYNLTVIDPGS